MMYSFTWWELAYVTHYLLVTLYTSRFVTTATGMMSLFQYLASSDHSYVKGMVVARDEEANNVNDLISHDNGNRLLDSLVVECWLRVREVPGSNPSQGPHHTKDVITMVVPLFSTQHWKRKSLALSQELRYMGHSGGIWNDRCSRRWNCWEKNENKEKRWCVMMLFETVILRVGTAEKNVKQES